MSKSVKSAVRKLFTAVRRPTARRLSVESLEAREVPAAFVVNTLADPAAFSPADATVSLREALTRAADTPGADTVTFATGSGTLTLNGTQLPTVTGEVAVAGPGPSLLTIDAGGQSRLFEVAPGGSLSLSLLKLTGGQADSGGAVWNDGRLGVVDCWLDGNGATWYGGAIYNSLDGTLSVTASTLSDNESVGGGAIATRGTMTLVNSTLVGNYGRAEAGAIQNAGYTTITNCTIALNSALLYDGGVTNTFFRAMQLNNNYIVNNSSQFGYVDDRKIPYMTPEMVGDGGPSHVRANRRNAEEAQLQCDELNRDLPPGAEPYYFQPIDFLHGRYYTNLLPIILPSNASRNLFGTFKGGNNVYEVDASVAFRPLGLNGGPTPTLAPDMTQGLFGIGQGNPSVAPPIDQRGVTRDPQSVDIGAYQSQPPTVALGNVSVIGNEGAVLTNGGTFDSRLGRGAVAFTASVGAVTANPATGTWSWSYAAPDQSPEQTITVRATDTSGEYRTVSSGSAFSTSARALASPLPVGRKAARSR